MEVVQDRASRCRLHHPHLRLLPTRGRREGQCYRIVGMENSAPLLMPEGQRCVTVLVLV
jgi:hypothetical protein